MIKLIDGGVCAAEGFLAGGIHCGIRKNRTKKDLSLIVSRVPASAAAVYTTNLVKGAPLTVTKEHIADGVAQAILCNSGNANTCNADGIEVAEKMSALLADALGIDPTDVVVASTGVIGQPLDITPIAKGIPALLASLDEHDCSAAAVIEPEAPAFCQHQNIVLLHKVFLYKTGALYRLVYHQIAFHALASRKDQIL